MEPSLREFDGHTAPRKDLKNHIAVCDALVTTLVTSRAGLRTGRWEWPRTARHANFVYGPVSDIMIYAGVLEKGRDS